MADTNRKIKINVAHLIIPFVICGIAVFILYKLGVDNNIKNLDKVLEGTVNFSAILLGFLGALLGILLSIKDSAIVKAIFNQQGASLLKYYFNESFATGLLVVVLSCVMQIFLDEETVCAKFLFLTWFFFVLFFVISTYRIVKLLMAVFFVANEDDARDRPESNMINDGERRKEFRQQLSNSNDR
ncbi:hypothetical protein N1I81_17875 [Bacillus sp. FSL M8-0052]|uniref:Uncharacterized protein n=1 Tax=Bacillus glycinifermentans TaxID=1664069 RepID=A0AAJ3Z0P4_9BACI|nr:MULTISPECIES: hypothetical protein [Bacillus]MDU0072628.1 hypothetical protein [Bacillus sp. IG6]MED8020422.1 hypothetical protein [Bacillus glycinifermentans]QAT66835.1 hypothetical protein EQZ20_19455 [Bacillus glycinifermentans]